MTPQPVSKPTPWWQTLLMMLANIAAGALVSRYLPQAGIAAPLGIMAAGTGIAHRMSSKK